MLLQDSIGSTVKKILSLKDYSAEFEFSKFFSNQLMSCFLSLFQLLLFFSICCSFPLGSSQIIFLPSLFITNKEAEKLSNILF